MQPSKFLSGMHNPVENIKHNKEAFFSYFTVHVYTNGESSLFATFHLLSH